MPYAAMLVAALLLIGVGLLTGGEEDEPAPPPPAPVARIAERVEGLRGLRFTRRPDVRSVTAAQAQRDALATLDDDYPPARRRADADVLVLLGLVPPGTDLGEAIESTYGEAVGGYYDPRSGKLRIVSGTATSNRVLYEMTVAHELTHALEDQRFDFDPDVLAGGDDRALGYTALVEGTATVLMLRYADARFGAEEALGGVLASAFQDTGDLPPFLTAQLTFPYIGGQALVEELLRVGGGRWAVIDSALRFRPPASSEQVLHPRKYLAVEAPRRVSLQTPPPGWRVLRRGTMGEWQTAQLLARAGDASSAAAGWGGDAYALLGRGDERALVARWTWDTPRDRRELVAALRRWAAAASPPGGAATAVGVRDGAVTLAIAPDAAFARRLARPDD